MFHIRNHLNTKVDVMVRGIIYLEKYTHTLVDYILLRVLYTLTAKGAGPRPALLFMIIEMMAG